MSRSQEPVRPRDGHTLVVGVVARISGGPNQKELSLEDQEDHAHQLVEEMHDDGVEEAATPEQYAAYITPIFRELVRVTRPGGLVALWQSRKYLWHFREWFGPNIKLFHACKGHVQWRDEPMADAVDYIVCQWKAGAKPLRPARQHGSVSFHVSHMQYDEWAKRHPCPRPLDVCEHLLKNFVPEGGYVLDPFTGSGSILVAAQRLGYPWMGVERNPEYRAVALKRLELYGRPAGSDCPATDD